MGFSHWSQSVLFENGYGVRACRAVLNDARLLAAACPGYEEADWEITFSFKPKEQNPKWHDLEFIDHTADVISDLHGALGGDSDEAADHVIADRAISALLKRHKPRGWLKWWNIAVHGQGLR